MNGNKKCTKLLALSAAGMLLCLGLSAGCAGSNSCFGCFGNSGGLYGTGMQIVLPHAPVDTSPYDGEMHDSTEGGIWQSLMDTPTSNDGVDYSDEYYARKQSGDYVYAHFITKEYDGKVYLVGYLGSKTDITLPKSLDGFDVISISDAFKDNTVVRSVTIPDCYESLGANAFLHCSALESVKLPGGLTTIESSTFSDCTALKSITLPKNVESICNHAFENCSSLKTIQWSKALTTIGDYAFSSCTSLSAISLPDSVTELQASAFDGCDALKSAALGKGVTTIPNSCFNNCESLSKITFGGKVTAIGSYAFSNTGFKEFAVPEGVTEIGQNAFAYCGKLTKVTIPASVISIDATAFRHCKKLARIEVSKDNPVYYSQDGVLFSRIDKSVVRYPSAKSGAYTLPGGIEKIGSYAFEGAAGLTDITLPDSLTVIGVQAFMSSGIQSISLPKKLTEIRTRAFAETPLKSITLPDSVTTLGGQVFDECHELTSATLGKGINSMDYGIFSACNKLASVKVSAGCKLLRVEGDMLIDNEQQRVIAILSTCPQKLVVPEGIKSLGAYCGWGCGITELVLPDSLESIDEGAFGECGSLAKIDLGKGIQLISGAAFKNCTSLRTVYIPDSVTEMDYSVFYGCTSLESVRLSEQLGVLPNSAFENCTSLKEIALPDSLVEIKGAFDGCTSLERVVMCGNAEKIDVYAFSECTALREIYYPAGMRFSTSCFCYDSLERIYYGGTKREWQLGFYINNGKYNDELDEVEIIFNSPRPTE